MLLVVFAALIGFATTYLFLDGSLFAYHPIAMMLAILISAVAVHLIKTKRNKTIHMILQLTASVLVIVGMYVIFVVKNEYGKPHFWTMEASYHAWGGAAAAVFFILGGVGSLVTVGPFAPVAADKYVREHHAAAGAFSMLFFGFVVLSGFYRKFGADNKFYLAVAIVGWVLGKTLYQRVMKKNFLLRVFVQEKPAAASKSK